MKQRIALVTAAGRGLRMGADRPKQFLRVAGAPLLAHTLAALAPEVSAFILVLPPEDLSEGNDIWQTYCRQIPLLGTIPGGSTRFASVAAGLALVPNDCLVAIHDGVRPQPPPEMVRRLFRAAEQYGAAIPVIPLTDSIRRCRPNGRSEAVPRTDYVAVQTPQIFRSELIRTAYSGVSGDTFTDDASVFETYYPDTPLALIPGSEHNIKVTLPADLLRLHNPMTIGRKH